MTDEPQARHVATEKDQGRGMAETAQPNPTLTAEQLRQALVDAASDPEFLDRMAQGLLDRIGAIPTAEEIAAAVADIRGERSVPMDSGHGQDPDVDDERRTGV
jgi:hypothetical protein